MKIIFFCLLVPVLIVSCKSKKQVQSIANPVSYQIKLGESGGFTGAAFEYTVMWNDTSKHGDVYYESTGVKASRDTFKIKKTDLIFWTEKFDSIKFHDNPSTSARGNLNRFLEYRSGEKKTRIEWAMPGKTPPANVPWLYEIIRGRLQKK